MESKNESMQTRKREEAGGETIDSGIYREELLRKASPASGLENSCLGTVYSR